MRAYVRRIRIQRHRNMTLALYGHILCMFFQIGLLVAKEELQPLDSSNTMEINAADRSGDNTMREWNHLPNGKEYKNQYNTEDSKAISPGDNVTDWLVKSDEASQSDPWMVELDVSGQEGKSAVNAGPFTSESDAEKRNLGSVMSPWLKQQIEDGQSVKRNLGSVMSSWLKQQTESSETGKRNLGSVMSSWLKEHVESGETDKRNLGSVMSSWLKHQISSGQNEKRYIGSVMSPWLQQQLESGQLDKRNLGSVMSSWLKQQIESNKINKKNLGSVMSSWLREQIESGQNEKRNLGSVMSSWLKQQVESGQLDKRNLGSVMSSWLKQQIESSQPDKRNLGSVMSSWLKEQIESGENEKRNLGSVMSPWLKQQVMAGGEKKNHMGSEMSPWLQTQLHSDEKDKTYDGKKRVKRHIGSAMSDWIVRMHNGGERITKRYIGSVMSEWLRKMTEPHTSKRRLHQPAGHWIINRLSESDMDPEDVSSTKRDGERSGYYDSADGNNLFAKRNIGSALNMARNSKADLKLYPVGYDPNYRSSYWRDHHDFDRASKRSGSKELSTWNGSQQAASGEPVLEKKHLSAIARQGQVPFPLTKYSASHYVGNGWANSRLYGSSNSDYPPHRYSDDVMISPNNRRAL